MPIALGDKAVADGMWRNDRRVFLPGMGWYNDWYLDRDLGRDFLSPHYYRGAAGKRPPIELVCPNVELWCIDRKSSNGDGWQVTGDWRNITCQPSIIAGDYHGWLRNGEFTPDIDGKTWPMPNVGPDYGRTA
ncbi:hypothetical protein KUL72_07845 [Bradyrhizobium arachidis]|uniref:DUF6527 family protein n=1 Tax=Bradyrhizobium arachidis TaxID=858423 RepID=UPI0021616D75|nr:DUF6527 family protein [Bradyrhizobium arachidis]UVO38266.1 hypothetical protein KUL72_07845 [Bradyrhizobium arachidis]